MIFGLPTSLKFGIVSMHCAISSYESVTIPSAYHLKELYPDRFEGIGEMPGQCKIVVISHTHTSQSSNATARKNQG